MQMPRQPNKALLSANNGGQKSGSATPNGTAAPSSKSVRSSRRSSIFPHGDFRNSQASLVDIKTDMMVQWLHSEQLRRGYTTGVGEWEGVILKKAKGLYTAYPPHLMQIQDGLFDMVQQMNVRVRMSSQSAEEGTEATPTPRFHWARREVIYD